MAATGKVHLLLSLVLGVLSAGAETLIRRGTAHHHLSGLRHQHSGLQNERHLQNIHRHRLDQDSKRTRGIRAFRRAFSRRAWTTRLKPEKPAVPLELTDINRDKPAVSLELTDQLKEVVQGGQQKQQVETQQVATELLNVMESITEYALKVEADGSVQDSDAQTLRGAAEHRDFRVGTMIHVPLEIPPGQWYLKQFPSSPMKKVFCSVQLSDDCQPLSDSLVEDGAAMVDFWSLLPKPDAAFRRMAKKEYNMLVAGNACKLGWIQPQRSRYNFTYCDEIRSFATERMRGDFSFLSIIGGDGFFTPEWLFSLAPEQKHTVLKDTVNNVMHHYDDVHHWTVVSEAISDDDNSGDPLKTSVWYPDVPNHIEAAFTEAAAVAPDATLIYSDYGGESLNLSHPGEPSKAKRILELVRGLLVRGFPIDGIGMQMHIGLWADHESWYEGLRKNIQYYADMLIEVHIDQMDVSTDMAHDAESVIQGSERNGDMLEHIAERQAHVYARVLGICLSFANCRSMTTWGFTDKQNPDASFASLPFDKNLQAKPAYIKMLEKLMFEKHALPLATCTDIPSQAMVDMGMRCQDAVNGFENKCYGENNDKELWLREKLCRQSCFAAGSPYPGDDCYSS